MTTAFLPNSRPTESGDTSIRGAAASNTPWKAFWIDLGARLRAQVLTRRTPPSLVLRETLSLGDKRFVALIECDGQRLLVGGAGQAVNLIARMNGEPS